MEFDSDDGNEDEVIFRFMADQFLGTNGEVCNVVMWTVFCLCALNILL